MTHGLPIVTDVHESWQVPWLSIVKSFYISSFSWFILISYWEWFIQKSYGFNINMLWHINFSCYIFGSFHWLLIMLSKWASLEKNDIELSPVRSCWKSSWYYPDSSFLVPPGTNNVLSCMLLLEKYLGSESHRTLNILL